MTTWEKIGLALAILAALAAVIVWRRGAPGSVFASSGAAPTLGGGWRLPGGGCPTGMICGT